MAKTTDGHLENEILSEGKLEADAQKAKQLLTEFSTWNAKAMAFIQETGNPPQDPLTFLRNVILTFGMKKLESKIITLS